MWVSQTLVNLRASTACTGGDIKKSPDLLDFYIFKGLSHNSLIIRPNLEWASDHTPIIATISTHIVTHRKAAKLHSSPKNWEAFRTQIEENLRLNIPLKTAKYIEEVIAEFTNVTQKAAWTATPEDKPQSIYPEYPWKVKDPIKKKQKFRRRLNMSRKRRYKETAIKSKDQI
jgi:hypothetical protein